MFLPITQTVRSFITLSKASCTKYSDSVSKASSKSSNFGLTSKARAMTIPFTWQN